MTTLLELKNHFYIEHSTPNNLNYGGYSDLSSFSIDELWIHANSFGYKENRVVFHNFIHNEVFYSLYLETHRITALNIDPLFSWVSHANANNLIYSEYYALLDFNNNRTDIAKPDIVTTPTVPANYSIIAECDTYEYMKFPYAYGAGQWSSSTFGIVIPYDSVMKKAYFTYDYESINIYNENQFFKDSYKYNDNIIKIQLDLYINGLKSDYYIKETLDPSVNMISVLFKKKNNLTDLTDIIEYNTIELKQDSSISWLCSDINNIDICGNSCNNPYNPSRNRLNMVLEYK